jgi:hypothetical protein
MGARVVLVLLFCTWSVVPGWAADVTGSWRVTISTSDGSIVGVALLEQSGEKVTGWLGPDEANRIPVSGVLNGSRLTLKTFSQPGRTVAFDTCELTVSDDKMAGSIERNGSPQGTIEFIRTRQ